MLGAGEALLQRLQDARQIAADERRGIEPETGEDLALVKAGLIDEQQLVAALAEDEPINRLIQHPPDDVLAHLISAIGVQLDVQVVAGAAGGDLRKELRPSRYIPV